MNIKEWDFKQSPLYLEKNLRIIIVQFNWLNEKDVDRHNKIWFSAKWDENKLNFVKSIFKFAQENDVKLIVFPEITYPLEYHYLAKEFCKINKDVIVVAGSSYEELEDRPGYWYSVSRTFVNENEYRYEKNKLSSSIEKNPIDFENTPIDGGTPCIFKNTIFGDVGILVCSDYLHDPLRNYYLETYKDISLLIVIAFNRKSESNYFKLFDAGIQNLKYPFPIIFSNNLMNGYGDGQSSFFSFLDNIRRESLLKEGFISDYSINHQIAEFVNEDGLIYLEHDFSQHRRGEKSKTIHSEPTFNPKFLVYDNKILVPLTTQKLLIKKGNESKTNKFDLNILPINERLPKINNVAHRRKKNQSSRNLKVIAEIALYFEENKSNDFSIVGPILLTGWSGEGKTTIATEFIYKYGSVYTSAFILDFSDPVLDQLKKIATLLGINYNEKDIHLLDKLKSLFLNHFEKSNSLLIFENVTNGDYIQEYLPKTGYSNVIILSTNSQLKKYELFHNVDLPKLDLKDAKEILCHGINISKDDFNSIDNFIVSIDYLTYCLELANSYLKKYSNLGISHLLDEYRTEFLAWEGTYANSNVNYSINTSPSILFLIEKVVSKITVNMDQNLLEFDILKHIGWMKIANIELCTTNYLKIYDTNSIDRKELERALNCLNEIGLLSINNDIWIVHGLFLNYLIKSNLDYKTLISVGNVVINKIESSNDMMLKTRLILAFQQDLLSAEVVCDIMKQLQIKYESYANKDVVLAFNSFEKNTYEYIVDLYQIYSFLFQLSSIIVGIRMMYYNWLDLEHDFDFSKTLNYISEKYIYMSKLKNSHNDRIEAERIYYLGLFNHLSGNYLSALEFYTQVGELKNNLHIHEALNVHLCKIQLMIVCDFDHSEIIESNSIFLKNIEICKLNKLISLEDDIFYMFRLSILLYFLYTRNNIQEKAMIEKEKYINLAEEFRELYSNNDGYLYSFKLPKGRPERYPLEIRSYILNPLNQKPVMVSDEFKLLLTW